MQHHRICDGGVRSPAPLVYKTEPEAPLTLLRELKHPMPATVRGLSRMFADVLIAFAIVRAGGRALARRLLGHRPWQGACSSDAAVGSRQKAASANMRDNPRTVTGMRCFSSLA